MDTRRLRYFIAIVDRGNITRAAEALHLAQPALSQHVAALETDFGQKLLVRSRRGVEPTAAGRSLYRYAQASCAWRTPRDTRSGTSRPGRPAP